MPQDFEHMDLLGGHVALAKQHDATLLVLGIYGRVEHNHGVSGRSRLDEDVSGVDDRARRDRLHFPTKRSRSRIREDSVEIGSEVRVAAIGFGA